MTDIDLPSRKKLPHDIPPWVAQGARHFITINCRDRSTPHLLQGHVATQLLEGARFYEQIGRWYVWLAVIMPDHLHLIATFDLRRGIKPIVKAWKGYHATRLGIEWQSDFFEHRLRNDQEYDEKAHYVRMNPVRAGLAKMPEEWPHYLDRRNIANTGGGCFPEGRANPPR